MSQPYRFREIGRVLKSNGTQGTVVIGLYGVSSDGINEKEPVYILMDGLPVPYFVEVESARGDTRILAHLTDVDTFADAEELVGKQLLVRRQTIDDGEIYGDFSGWTLFDASATDANGNPVKSGILDGMELIPGNPCLVLGDRLIPFNEDLVVSIDSSTRTLVMNVPVGLLD